METELAGRSMAVIVTPTLSGDASGVAAQTPPGEHTEDATGDAVVLALPSSSCFSFFRSSAEMRQLNSRNLMAYELEEYLPLNGDDLAIDHLSSPAGSLVVAADGSMIAPSVSALGDRGIYVAAVTPIIVLATATLQRQHDLRTVDVIVWRSSEGIDLILLDDGKPITWRWCEENASSVALGVEALIGQGESCAALLVDGSREIAEALDSCSHVSELALTRDSAALVESDRIVRGLSRPLVDLRSGPLESAAPHRPIATALRVSLLALLILQLCAAGALILRGAMYHSETSKLVATQEEAFRRTFPGEPVPVGLVSRLQSEHRRLSGTRGVSGQRVPKLGSAIRVAHVLLSALPAPTDARYTIERLELEPNMLALATGTAKSYDDVETIADGLRTAGFDVPPVSASTTSSGVTLRFDQVELMEEGAN